MPSEYTPHSVFHEFVRRHTLGGLKVIPVYRKMGPALAGADAFERARDIEEVLDALPGLLEQLEVAGRLAEAAMYVGMWGASYHELLAERLAEFEKETGWSLAASNPASEPPVSSRGGLPFGSSSGPQAPNQDSKPKEDK